MVITSPYHSPELWGGIECTINRIGSTYRDQLRETGHYDRDGDIALLASCGIKKLRYPILWEKHQADAETVIDWSWTEAKLDEIRDCGMEPIAGLLHHGSGPSYTSLLDENFPEKFAAYAQQVAQQFPWLTYYTPVNEPLTTARFSGLYGLWYPHLKQQADFYKMLVNQIAGTIMAMQKIREINPAAKLVQTEDLAKIHSTPLLAYQADFENERRWLSYDLLCGKVDQQHYFWNHLLKAGIPVHTLHLLQENACPPDIMGLNYYVTSERFLDHHLDQYPATMHGTNGRHNYADTEAVRAGCAEGLQSLMKEAWERFHITLAVTECYMDCSREEQLRWLMETWETACTLNKQGVPVTAVTPWSLFGSFDWDTLLTSENNSYAPGAFDIRSDPPRPTALARMIQELGNGGCAMHPVMSEKGWWHKKKNQLHISPRKDAMRLVLISNENSLLLEPFKLLCELRSIEYLISSSEDLHEDESIDLKLALASLRPWGIVDLTQVIGLSDMDDHNFTTKNSFSVNLADAARELEVRFLGFSPEYRIGQVETEELILDVNSAALVIRSARTGDDPSELMTLANIAMDLLIDDSGGIYEMENGAAYCVSAIQQ